MKRYYYMRFIGKEPYGNGKGWREVDCWRVIGLWFFESLTGAIKTEISEMEDKYFDVALTFIRKI